MDRNTIDVARGIGIILVVFAHLIPNYGPFFAPYVFHMPLFFFLSGLTLSPHRSVRQSIFKDLIGIVCFYLVMIFILALVSGPLQSWGVSAKHTSIYNWKTYFVFPFTRNSHHVELFLVGWFLVALLFARYLSIAVLRLGAGLRSSVLIPACIAASVGWIGMNVLPVHLEGGQPWYLNLSSQVCVGTMYCVFGAIVRRAPIVWPEKACWPTVASYLLLSMSGVPPLAMAWSQYPGGFALHAVGTTLGIAATLLASRVLRQSMLLQFVGQHTKAIMSWHLASFALLNLWYVQTSGFQQTGVFGMFRPTLYWPIYLGAGLVLPLALAIAWQASQDMVRKYSAALFDVGHGKRVLFAGRRLSR